MYTYSASKSRRYRKTFLVIMGSKKRWKSMVCLVAAFFVIAFLLLDVRDLLKTLNRRMSESGQAAAKPVAEADRPLNGLDKKAALSRAKKLLAGLSSDEDPVAHFEELHLTLSRLRASSVGKGELTELFNEFNQELKDDNVVSVKPLDVNLPPPPRREPEPAGGVHTAPVSGKQPPSRAEPFVGTLLGNGDVGLHGWACRLDPPSPGPDQDDGSGMSEGPAAAGVRVKIFVGGSSESGGGHFAGDALANGPVPEDARKDLAKPGSAIRRYCKCELDDPNACLHGFTVNWADLAIPDHWAGHQESVFAVAESAQTVGIRQTSVVGFIRLLLPVDPAADKKAKTHDPNPQLENHVLPWDSFDGGFEVPELAEGTVALSGAGGSALLAGSPWLFSGRAGIWRPPTSVVPSAAGAVSAAADPSLLRRRRSIASKHHGHKGADKNGDIDESSSTSVDVAQADAAAERKQEALAGQARKSRDNAVRAHSGFQLGVLQDEGSMSIYIQPITLGVEHRLVCYFSKKPGDPDGHIDVEIRSRPGVKVLAQDSAFIDFFFWRKYTSPYFVPHTEEGIQLVISASAMTKGSLLIDSCLFEMRENEPEVDGGEKIIPLM